MKDRYKRFRNIFSAWEMVLAMFLTIGLMFETSFFQTFGIVVIWILGISLVGVGKAIYNIK